MKSGRHDDVSHKQDLVYAGILQLSLATLTSVALIARIIQDPRRLKTNTTGIIMRTGIIAMDLVSGALLLSDLEEKTILSLAGKSLMTCSIFVSRILAEDGHHDQVNTTEKMKEEKSHDIENPNERTPLRPISGYGSTT